MCMLDKHWLLIALSFEVVTHLIVWALHRIWPCLHRAVGVHENGLESKWLILVYDIDMWHVIYQRNNLSQIHWNIHKPKTKYINRKINTFRYSIYSISWFVPAHMTILLYNTKIGRPVCVFDIFIVGFQGRVEDLYVQRLHIKPPSTTFSWVLGLICWSMLSCPIVISWQTFTNHLWVGKPSPLPDD